MMYQVFRLAAAALAAPMLALSLATAASAQQQQWAAAYVDWTFVDRGPRLARSYIVYGYFCRSFHEAGGTFMKNPAGQLAEQILRESYRK